MHGHLQKKNHYYKSQVRSDFFNALKAHEYIYSLQPFQKKATMPNFKEKFICK